MDFFLNHDMIRVIKVVPDISSGNSYLENDAGNSITCICYYNIFLQVKHNIVTCCIGLILYMQLSDDTNRMHKFMLVI